MPCLGGPPARHGIPRLAHATRCRNTTSQRALLVHPGTGAGATLSISCIRVRAGSARGTGRGRRGCCCDRLRPADRADWRPVERLHAYTQGVPTSPGSEGPACRRCGLAVVANLAQYDVFEGMHYVCFHYEFEHRGDPDVECHAGGCPASGTVLASLRWRVAGADLLQAGNTVVPAILALRQLGCTVALEGETVVASLGDARFRADDPVAVLGLIKLVETRHPWSASDAEIHEILQEFGLDD